MHCAVVESQIQDYVEATRSNLTNLYLLIPTVLAKNRLLFAIPLAQIRLIPPPHYWSVITNKANSMLFPLFILVLLAILGLALFGLVTLIKFILHRREAMMHHPENDTKPEQHSSTEPSIDSLKEAPTPYQTSLARMAARNKANLTRYAVIGAIALALLIPLAWVDDIIRERHDNYQSVLNEISSLWGEEQTLVGPLLTIPYQEQYEVSNSDGKIRLVTRQHTAVLLPQQLKIHGDIQPSYRERGLYRSLVYKVDIDVEGDFSGVHSAIKKLSQRGKLHKILWHKARLSVGVTDPKGIVDAQQIHWGNMSFPLAPGIEIDDTISQGGSQGFHADIGSALADSSNAQITSKITAGIAAEATTGTSINKDKSLPFSFKLTLNGSEGFRATALAARTELVLQSSWPHPSFYGDVLPANSVIDEHDGFEANWSIPLLVRSVPQSWTLGSQPQDLLALTAGVRLFEPVTLYTAATRASKYGLLFIGLTFLALLLIEVTRGQRANALQYALVGLSLALFYLLLIALAEHTGFGMAYLAASLLVMVMIGGYSAAVLQKRLVALMIAAILGVLYGVLYLILQAEDYALLAGTLLLTVALAITMYATRKLHLNTDVTAYKAGISS